jgi:hypothetical protein
MRIGTLLRKGDGRIRSLGSIPSPCSPTLSPRVAPIGRPPEGSIGCGRASPVRGGRFSTAPPARSLEIWAIAALSDDAVLAEVSDAALGHAIARIDASGAVVPLVIAGSPQLASFLRLR